MSRRQEIKRDLRRFRNEKPFYTPTEEVPPRFAKKLRNQGWDFKPAGANKKLGAEGGHWVPPGYRVIKRAPQDYTHGKHYA